MHQHHNIWSCSRRSVHRVEWSRVEQELSGAERSRELEETPFGYNDTIYCSLFHLFGGRELLSILRGTRSPMLRSILRGTRSLLLVRSHQSRASQSEVRFLANKVIKDHGEAQAANSTLSVGAAKACSSPEVPTSSSVLSTSKPPPSRHQKAPETPSLHDEPTRTSVGNQHHGNSGQKSEESPIFSSEQTETSSKSQISGIVDRTASSQQQQSLEDSSSSRSRTSPRAATTSASSASTSVSSRTANTLKHSRKYESPKTIEIVSKGLPKESLPKVIIDDREHKVFKIAQEENTIVIHRQRLEVSDFAIGDAPQQVCDLRTAIDARPRCSITWVQQSHRHVYVACSSITQCVFSNGELSPSFVCVFSWSCGLILPKRMPVGTDWNHDESEVCSV